MMSLLLWEMLCLLVGAKRHNVNSNTHSPYTGEVYDYSKVEAQFGPYDRPDKPPITVTLRPSAKDMP